MQISESTSAMVMYSGSVYAPTKGQLRISTLRLTVFDRSHRNKEADEHTLPEREEQNALDTQKLSYKVSEKLPACNSRTGLNGLRSLLTATQNMAKQLYVSRVRIQLSPY